MGIVMQVHNPPNKRRVKRLKIEVDAFLTSLGGLRWPNLVECEGLPDDARCVALVTDQIFNTVEMLIESATFDEVAPQYVVPELTLSFHTWTPEIGKDGEIIFRPEWRAH